jgi:hypothetical protein
MRKHGAGKGHPISADLGMLGALAGTECMHF